MIFGVEEDEGGQELLKRKKRRWDGSPAIGGPSTSTIGAPIGRTDPQLIAYAVRVYGNTNLTEEQWKQCEDQIKACYIFSLYHSIFSTSSKSLLMEIVVLVLHHSWAWYINGC